MRGLQILGLMLALVLCGCHRKAPEVASTPALPTHAQPKLQTMKLWLGAEEMIAELALTQEQVMTGMMFRTNMADNEGMLFVFSEPIRAEFWMKNCSLPLSAAYIGPDGAILEIHPLEPFNTNSVNSDTEQVQFVLETPQGWFDRHHVGVGTVVRTERGALRDNFSFRSNR